MNIQLLRFNNYYNRVFKQIDEPEWDRDSIVAEQRNVNFNPNDGVNTSIVLNITLSSIDVEPNYAVVFDNENEIISRWFIIEAVRTRLNQYALTLRRDLLADYYDSIVNAPTFIEKATVGFGNPLLFNSEDMTFNQIKTRETPIWDKTQCAWIVGYIESNTPSTTITAQLDKKYVIEKASIDLLPLYNRLTPDKVFNALNVDSVSLDLKYMAKGADPSANQNLAWVDFNENGYLASGRTGGGVSQMEKSRLRSTKYGEDWAWQKGKNLNNAAGPVAREASAIYKNQKEAFLTALYQQTALGRPEELSEFLSTYPESGVIVKIGNSYKKIRRVSLGSTYLAIKPTGELLNLFINMANNMSELEVLGWILGVPDNAGFTLNCYQNSYQLVIEDISVPRQSVKVVIPGPENRNHLEDAPYDMFCIPYQPSGYTRYFTCEHAGGVNQRVINSEAAMAIAEKISLTLGSQLYDIQLLPYCPVQEVIYERGVNLYTSNYNVEGVDFSIIEGGEGSTRTAENAMIWCRYSQFSTTMDYNISVGPEPKIEAMCDMYRLVSPNYNGQFQFNHVMNEGVEYFEIECSYKPYNPYIHIAPNFKGLYGADYNDARGLICGGDFSLPTMSSAWTNYEINNKNYLNAFNRQIQNLEINNKYQKQSDIWAAVAGTVQGGVSGATTGFVAGGGVGAAIGGTAGTLISAAGGVADVSINEKLRSEALDYTKDQFGYTLGNIAAMPDSLTRVSAFNINNKVFPILEYYTCSDIEKQALRDKIKYNGMTVMKIGTINEYLQPTETYIKGRLIRLDGFDNHTTIEIANELNKGFYI